MNVKIVQAWVAGKSNECLACRTLKKETRRVLDELELKDVPIELCESQEEFDSYGIIVTPMLIVSGKVKSMGKVPTLSRVRFMIEEELTAETTT